MRIQLGLGATNPEVRRDAMRWETAHLKISTYTYLPAYHCDFQRGAHV